MNHLDEWLHLIANQLKSEAERVGAQAKSELYEDAARDSFVRIALEPLLPTSYAVGSGKIIDAAGNISAAQDIVIYRSDYPQFNMPGSHDVFIYESVLATIQVRSKLVRKTFSSALDQCASLATLNPAIEAATLRALAQKMKMQMDSDKQYLHANPLQTGRFNLIARPPAFIYGFTGYQTSEQQLAENLNKWIDDYHQSHTALQMKSLPAVIATQGCFAWRNTAPFAFKSAALMGVGADPAPLRLIILQLLHAFNRRLQNTSDGYGIKSTIAPYLAHFTAPKITQMAGIALNPGSKSPQAHVVEKTPPVASAAAAQAEVDKRIAKAAEAAAEHNQSRPLIRNLSAALANRKQSEENPAPESRPAPSAKASNPLATFANHEDEAEIDDYQFEPVEPVSAQKLPNQIPGQATAEDAKDPLMDTLVEAPEDMEKIKSEARANKSEYVTESLIR